MKVKSTLSYLAVGFAALALAACQMPSDGHEAMEAEEPMAAEEAMEGEEAMDDEGAMEAEEAPEA